MRWFDLLAESIRQRERERDSSVRSDSASSPCSSGSTKVALFMCPSEPSDGQVKDKVDIRCKKVYPPKLPQPRSSSSGKIENEIEILSAFAGL